MESGLGLSDCQTLMLGYSHNSKGNTMQGIKIVTVNQQGLVHEFIHECNTPELALATIQGVMNACKSTGWTMKEMEIA